MCLRANTGLVLVAFLLCLSGCESFVAGQVPSETGFEGAVTVIGENVQGEFGIVTVEIPYVGIRGEALIGLAQVYVHKDAMLSGELLPPFCHVFYAMDGDEAAKWAERGWAVFSAGYTDAAGEHPQDIALGQGNNLARAIIQWARRVPFVDRTRLHIDGLSQGGYVALAMAADFFPVTATTSDFPIVNWAYTMTYVEANKAASGYPGNLNDSPLPLLFSVSDIPEKAYAYFGNDLADGVWHALSPLSYLERITGPMLVTATTGDLLVPIEQYGSDLSYETTDARFPENYQRDFETLTLVEDARVRLEDAFETGQATAFLQSLPEDVEPRPADPPSEVLDKAWSEEHQWSLLYLNEGPPIPFAQDHTVYAWNLSPDSFTKAYRKTEPSVELLNAAKLERLMERYTGNLSDLPRLRNGNPANRLNYESPEQRDVLAGLLAYGESSNAHAAQLIGLYEAGGRKPFGDTLSLDALRRLLAELEG